MPAKLFLLLLAALLAGCAATPTYVSDNVAINRLRTADPEIIRQRWGDLAAMASGVWKRRVGHVLRAGKWEVEGVVLSVREIRCLNTTLFYSARCEELPFLIYFDPATGRHKWHHSFYGEVSAEDTYVSAVMPDGSVAVEPGSTPGWEKNRMIMRRDSSGDWILFDAKSGSVLEQEWRQIFAQRAKESSRESREFWSNVAQATLSASQTFAAERANAPPAFVPHIAPPQRPTVTSVTPSSVGQRAPQVASGNKFTQISPSASRPATQQAAATSVPTAKPEGPKRSPYPEAVVVCTIPSGEQGRFVCENPVNRVSGHKDINPGEWRTPESMVASFSGSCSNARPLRSTTHRVWGCGFAATNKIVGYYDRAGPGVDVQGRQTFYCVEREQGCRRTQP